MVAVKALINSSGDHLIKVCVYEYHNDEGMRSEQLAFMWRGELAWRG